MMHRVGITFSSSWPDIIEIQVEGHLNIMIDRGTSWLMCAVYCLTQSGYLPKPFFFLIFSKGEKASLL